MQVEQNQSPTNTNIILSVLRNLTGLKFKDGVRHMKSETSVNVQLSPRVEEPLSSDVNVVNRQAGIDKADCRLYECVAVEVIKARANELGLPLRHMKIGKNKKQVLRIGDPEGEHIYLELRHIQSPFTRTILTNPNKFRSAERYFQFLVSLFGINHFEYMKLFRLDFNVDLPVSFNAVRKMLRVKYKQLNARHDGRSSRITGLNFGGGDESVCAYNKAYQVSKNETSDDLRSRIEIRLKGKRLPIKKIHELPMVIKNTKYGRPINPFYFLSLEPFTLADESSIKDPKKLRKLVYLKSLIEASSLDYAIRKLNQNGNFMRDYKGLIEFHESPYDLDDILLNNLFDFFGKRRPVQL